MGDIFTYRSEHRARLTRHDEAVALHARLLDKYSSLLDLHQEHQGMGETTEAKKLQPEIHQARTDLEAIEFELVKDGDEETMDLAAAALEDGAARFQDTRDKQGELLVELEEIKKLYFKKLGEIGANQNQAGGVALEISRINKLLKKSDRVHVPRLRVPVASELELDLNLFGQALGRLPFWSQIS